MKRLAVFLAASVMASVCVATAVTIEVTLVEAKVSKADGYAKLYDANQGHVGYVFGGEDFKASKPYVKELVSPKGVNPLRDNVADHIHHHGLMFAVAIDGVDFWSETRKCGRQIQRDISEVWQLSPRFVLLPGIKTPLEWTKPDGTTVVATEKRTIQMNDGVGATLMTWRTQLSPPDGKDSIKITGSHYFGLGMRFVQSMDNASTFAFADPNAKSEAVRGDEKLTPSEWAACTGKVDGNTVTVAMFDHPANSRPVLWFTMSRPFSYLSATIDLHRKALVVKAGEKLDVRYGAAVWDGEPGRDRIEAAYKEWLEPSGLDLPPIPAGKTGPGRFGP